MTARTRELEEQIAGMSTPVLAHIDVRSMATLSAQAVAAGDSAAHPALDAMSADDQQLPGSGATSSAGKEAGSVGGMAPEQIRMSQSKSTSAAIAVTGVHGSPLNLLSMKKQLESGNTLNDSSLERQQPADSNIDQAPIEAAVERHMTRSATGTQSFAMPVKPEDFEATLDSVARDIFSPLETLIDPFAKQAKRFFESFMPPESS